MKKKLSIFFFQLCIKKTKGIRKKIKNKTKGIRKKKEKKKKNTKNKKKKKKEEERRISPENLSKK